MTNAVQCSDVFMYPVPSGAAAATTLVAPARAAHRASESSAASVCHRGRGLSCESQIDDDLYCIHNYAY